MKNIADRYTDSVERRFEITTNLIDYFKLKLKKEFPNYEILGSVNISEGGINLSILKDGGGILMSSLQVKELLNESSWEDVVNDFRMSLNKTFNK